MVGAAIVIRDRFADRVEHPGYRTQRIDLEAAVLLRQMRGPFFDALFQIALEHRDRSLGVLQQGVATALMRGIWKRTGRP